MAGERNTLQENTFTQDGTVRILSTGHSLQDTLLLPTLQILNLRSAFSIAPLLQAMGLFVENERSFLLLLLPIAVVFFDYSRIEEKKLQTFSAELEHASSTSVVNLFYVYSSSSRLDGIMFVRVWVCVFVSLFRLFFSSFAFLDNFWHVFARV